MERVQKPVLLTRTHVKRPIILKGGRETHKQNMLFSPHNKEAAIMEGCTE